MLVLNSHYVLSPGWFAFISVTVDTRRHVPGVAYTFPLVDDFWFLLFHIVSRFLSLSLLLSTIQSIACRNTIRNNKDTYQVSNFHVCFLINLGPAMRVKGANSKRINRRKGTRGREEIIINFHVSRDLTSIDTGESVSDSVYEQLKLTTGIVKRRQRGRMHWWIWSSWPFLELAGLVIYFK